MGEDEEAMMDEHTHTWLQAKGGSTNTDTNRTKWGIKERNRGFRFGSKVHTVVNDTTNGRKGGQGR
jgi:hypothetical protein